MLPLITTKTWRKKKAVYILFFFCLYSFSFLDDFGFKAFHSPPSANSVTKLTGLFGLFLQRKRNNVGNLFQLVTQLLMLPSVIMFVCTVESLLIEPSVSWTNFCFLRGSRNRDSMVYPFSARVSHWFHMTTQIKAVELVLVIQLNILSGNWKKVLDL